MKNLRNKLVAFVPLAFLLAACDQSFSPFQANLSVSRDLALRTDSGRPLALQGGNSYSPVIRYNGAVRKTVLSFGKERVTFRRGKMSGGSLYVDPSRSGQEGLGVRASRKLVAQDSVRNLVNVSCTYLVNQPRSRCWNDSNGNTRCGTFNEQVPFPGVQLVEEIRTISSFNYNGAIIDNSGVEGARFSGRGDEVDVSRTPMSSCR